MSTEPTRGGKPHYCHNGHEEIRFSALACPLCVVLARVQELERERDDLTTRLRELRSDNERLRQDDTSRVVELEREVARLRDDRDLEKRMRKDSDDRATTLEEEVARLKGYAQHKSECRTVFLRGQSETQPECDCGLLT